MNSTQISQNVHDVVKSINKETFFAISNRVLALPKQLSRDFRKVD
jgi:hypothetical protein